MLGQLKHTSVLIAATITWCTDMISQKVLEDYVIEYDKLSAASEQLSRALKVLDSDNVLYGLSSSYIWSVEQILHEVMGSEKYEIFMDFLTQDMENKTKSFPYVVDLDGSAIIYNNFTEFYEALLK